MKSKQVPALCQSLTDEELDRMAEERLKTLDKSKLIGHKETVAKFEQPRKRFGSGYLRSKTKNAKRKENEQSREFLRSPKNGKR